MAKVLIIEDDPSINRLYKNLFTLNKYTVESTLTGLGGIESAKKFLPDIILLDVMLPDMNGLEVLKNLKSDPVSKNIKVIVLTNVSEDKIIKDAMLLGADGVYTKATIAPENLLTEVATHLKS